MIKDNKKVVFSLSPLLNYLKTTDMEVGLLLNFGVKPELKGRYTERR
ncbi:MAG: hypothetical protein E3K37_18715 [Candidatus Kuenenia sp.]|nr:hypothetical protein [Candidatus Kuenenia hertensis]